MNLSGSRVRLCAALAALTPVLALVCAAPAQSAVPSPHRVAVPGTHPAWADPSADQGAVSATTPVTARIYLAGRDPAGLDAYARAVSDPHSEQYRHFLTPQDVQERFGASAEQLDAIRGWLDSESLEVTAANDHYLTVTGTAEQAEHAFAVKLHRFRRDGQTFQAPTGDASLPAAVAPAVLSVYGLNTQPGRVHHGRGDRPADAKAAAPASAAPAGAAPRDTLPGPGPAFVNAPPYSAYFGETPATGTPPAYGEVRPYVIQGLTGAQLRSGYGLSGSGLTGQGVTVAVVDAYDSPTLGDDVAQYAAAHGDAPYGRDQLLRQDPAVWTHTADPSVDPNGCGAQGWYGEQTLDVEAVHAVAPSAAIRYVGASSCQDADLIDALDRVVDGHLADIVSNSWGEAETQSDPALDAVYGRTFRAGAAEGIGFYFSSGDDGDQVANTGIKQTDVPASYDFVTAVGGTSLALDKDGQYAFETGWGTLRAPLSADGTSWTGLPGAFNGGAGGGTSGRVDQPFYQQGVVPEELSGALGGEHRVVPDIAAVADPNTGFLVGQTQAFPDGSVKYSEYRIGGTSLAAPVIAGFQALAQQAAGSPLGFANPAIYDRFGSSTFHQVTDHPFGPDSELAQVRVDFVNRVDASQGTVTSLRTMGKDTSLHAVEGYNPVTGVGTPTADYFASYLSTPASGGARHRR